MYEAEDDNIFSDPETGAMRISIGDLGANGVKDLLFVTQSHKIKAYSVEKTSRNGLKLEKYDIPELNHENSAVGASFFDLDDTGSHSMLVETIDHNVKGYLHIHKEGNYVLKALAFQKAYTGQARVGVTFQYLMTDIDGTEILYTAAQSTSNAYRALQMPFMLSGLGRCQNYIEHLTFGRYPLVSFFFLYAHGFMLKSTNSLRTKYIRQ